MRSAAPCASRASVTIGYDAPLVQVWVGDDGTASPPPGAGAQRGHGIDGMRERAALHEGTLLAGPAPAGGWAVSATLRCGESAGRAA